MFNLNTQWLARSKVFLSYYRPYWKWLLADILCACLVSATALILPLCARHITQSILQDSSSHALTQLGIMGGVMVGLVAIQTIANFFVDYQGHMMGAKMESDLRTDLFTHYQALPFSFYDEQKTGQLMSRITHDLFWLSELYHHGPEDMVISFLNIMGAFIILLSINVPLTLIIFLFVPVMAVYALYFNRQMNRALSHSKDRISDINAQVEDTLGGIRVVKSFTNEALEQEKFAYANERFLNSRRDGYRSDSLFAGGMGAFIQLFTITVILCGGVGIIKGGLDLADLLTFLLYLGSLTDPIHRAVNFTRLFQEGITGFNRFIELMEVVPTIQDSPNAINLTHVQGQVAFENVSFRYKADHEDVIKHLSLTIHAGEYVALVGASGVGKTTLCNLIPRFYEVTTGAILLDGRPIQEICLQSLRHQIGMVQQDVYLFAGTVAENIGYGDLHANREAIIQAAKQSNAHDFIMALPDGYDTDIGQRGVKLSGGQKQRLSIARVFLKNPPIIIFDEATSALDNESEKAIQESIETLTANRTMLVIAHRLSTVRNADRIIVLTEAGVAEQGSHQALLALGGHYAALHKMQLRL